MLHHIYAPLQAPWRVPAIFGSGSKSISKMFETLGVEYVDASRITPIAHSWSPDEQRKMDLALDAWLADYLTDCLLSEDISRWTDTGEGATQPSAEPVILACFENLVLIKVSQVLRFFKYWSNLVPDNTFVL